MLLENELYQNIDLYLENKLEGKSLIDFENELRTNINLQNKVKTVKLLNDLILENQLQILKNQINSDLKKISLKKYFNFSFNFMFVCLIGFFIPI